MKNIYIIKKIILILIINTLMNYLKDDIFLSDGDVVILKQNTDSENKIYTIYGFGREEDVTFPQSASYKLVEINLKCLSFNIIENSLLKFLCYLNKSLDIDINNFINKNLNNELKNINIQNLEKIGKIDGKFSRNITLL